MTSKIIDWDAGHTPLPNTITFKGSDSTWALRITADRKIEVNNDIEVSVLAQQVLDALQILLKPKEWQSLSDDEIWDIANFLGKNKECDYPVMFAKTIERALREKNRE